MPTYRNNHPDMHVTINGVFFPAGALTATDRYFEHAYLELISHAPPTRPAYRLYSGNVPTGMMDIPCSYKEIVIVNDTDKVVSVWPNEIGRGDFFEIQPGYMWKFAMNSMWGAIKVDGEGIGNLHIYLVK